MSDDYYNGYLPVVLREPLNQLRDRIANHEPSGIHAGDRPHISESVAQHMMAQMIEEMATALSPEQIDEFYQQSLEMLYGQSGHIGSEN